MMADRPASSNDSSGLDGSVSFCDLSDEALEGSLGASHTWARNDEWDLASNGTAGDTGPSNHNLVPPGVVGAEYRMMKEALETTAPRGGGTPQRDPYHGRCIDPKCAPT